MVDRKTYVTKDQKDQFLKWYLRTYGYNTSSSPNSKTLSIRYSDDTGVAIPKLTIYRWITNTNLLQKYLAELSHEYISLEVIEQIGQVTNHIPE